MHRRIGIIAVLAVSLLMGGCLGRVAPPRGQTEPGSQTPSDSQTPPAANQALNPVEQKIGDAAAAALAALRDDDLTALAAVVHPVQGVRFSPYGHVITDGEYAHKLFSAADLAAPGLLDETFVWGAYDGSGEDIVLPFKDYLARFAYNYEYTAAPLVGWNTVVKEGNTILNHHDVYPGSLFVDFHFPGSAEYDGMDWGTLRLVFTEHDGNWYVVGIIHDQWTI